MWHKLHSDGVSGSDPQQHSEALDEERTNDLPDSSRIQERQGSWGLLLEDSRKSAQVHDHLQAQDGQRLLAPKQLITEGCYGEAWR